MGTCEPGGRRIDFFVVSASMVGRVGVEDILGDAPLHPHWPVRLDVTVGGLPALVPMLGTPVTFIAPDDPLPVGPRPSGEREWQGRAERWGGLLGARDI